MASFRKVGKNWYYRFVDENGIQRERKGCPDRRETERIAAGVEMEVIKLKAGLIDRKTVGFVAQENKSPTDHLEDYYAYLASRGTKDHADLVKARCARVIALARFKRLSDFSPSRLQSALKAVRDEGASLRTIHHYVRQFKGFSQWLFKDGRTRENPLAHVVPPNPDPDRRHERRALSAEELDRLFCAAEKGGVYKSATGIDRAALYRLAAGTGFRANELRTLTPEVFNLDGEPPTVTVKAGYSKRRRDDVQPIRSDLANALRPWLASKPAGQPVFGKLTKHTAELIRHDLETAGIVYRDSSNRVVDFHALRHSYITALAMTQAPVKVVQTLARHSTPTLTLGTYAHVGFADQTTALNGIPRAGANPPKAIAESSPTGEPIRRVSMRPPLVFPYGGDGSRQAATETGEAEPPKKGSFRSLTIRLKSMKKEALDASCGVQSDTVVSGGGGIRTHGTLAGTPVFETGPFNHSGTPPRVAYSATYSNFSIFGRRAWKNRLKSSRLGSPSIPPITSARWFSLRSVVIR